MPNVTHDQIHELLLGIGAVQHINGDLLTQGPDGRPDANRHGAYVGALRAAAGQGDAPTIKRFFARMALTHAFAPERDPARLARQREWELEQIRRLFPE